VQQPPRQTVHRLVTAVVSTRRGQIEEQLATAGATGARAAQVACLDTRPAKANHSTAQTGLRERWRIRAHGAGFDPAELIAKMLRHDARDAPTNHNSVAVATVTRTLLGPDGLTQQQSTFDRDDVLRALCERLPPTASVNYDAFSTLG
jgi:hypothetical protein